MTIRVLNSQAPTFNAALAELLDRTETETNPVEQVVADIIKRIRLEGDAALVDLTSELDQLEVTSAEMLELSDQRIDDIAQTVEPTIAQALAAASKRIRDYHQREVNTSWEYTADDGTVLGQKITPLDRVGIYVPGGKAAYPSSVMMTAIPASVAGVGQVIMVVPTPSGEVNSAVILAAKLSGVDRIFTIGGAQAVAALAYGTESIPAVDKIVGPGNIYVATAKKQVFGKVGIDMIAGPSEVAVICDEAADPDWVAMDLFAQAEHDELAQSVVITDSEQMVNKIQASIEQLLPTMERRKIIQTALAAQGAIIQASSLQEAAQISNRIAPEHLELMVDDPETLSHEIKHAGAIFMGRYSAESLGDYCAGPNHVLPTAGTARFSSPLGVYDYQKRSSLIYASKQGAAEMAEIASVLARCEGLTAHARSAEYRLEDQK